MSEKDKNSELEIILSEKFINRFWAKVKKLPNGCWDWQGSLMPKTKYGQVRVGGKIRRSHQVAYSIHHRKPIPALLRHYHCNNSKCCNPSHLLEGTHTENMEDMFNAFRHTSQKAQKEEILTKIVKMFSIDEKKMLYNVLRKEFE